MLQRALPGSLEADQSSAEIIGPARAREGERFDQYELVLDEDGQPLELGRGAMGVTYKALDMDLRCPVALKVISEKYLGDDAARLRFLREARAAASVRHPNVASVFHLGREGHDYFYAMEFVEVSPIDSKCTTYDRIQSVPPWACCFLIGCGYFLQGRKWLSASEPRFFPPKAASCSP
jgi:hypothetical protein